MQDLSVETGVPVTFLEDEVDVLLEFGLVDIAPGSRYETNLCIVDRDACEALSEHYAAEASSFAEQLYDGMMQHESELRSIGFHRSNMDQNQFVWLAPVLMYHVMSRTVQREILAYYPLLKTRARAWTWANERRYHVWEGRCGSPFDNEGHKLLLCDFRQLNRVSDRPWNIGIGPGRGDWKQSINLLSRMTGHGLEIDSLDESDQAEAARLVEEHFAAIDGGRLIGTVPVLSKDEYEAFFAIVDDQLGLIEDWFRKMHGDTTEILRTHLPKRFAADIRQYAYLQTLLSKAYVMECLVDGGKLTIPERHTHAMMIVPVDTPGFSID